ncbi:hypothetical protein [Providencia rettgeri]|uniref:hypothetical protein n=1 Tax=Providencia rettgeri TaxID=587 RepID=UPI00205ABE1C|nr:hypothetical protein [Providencia rettgeri]UPS63000.1 hypothetical protein M0M83_00145 [Providencia rettgeri]
MHQRLTPARYSHPVIRDHLVSQYVIGTLSRRVSKRLESIMATDVTWAELVMQWHSYLDELEPMTLDKPPSWVWRDIKMVIGQEKKKPFYHNLLRNKWSLIPLACSVFLFIFASMMLLMVEPQTSTPSYVATMSSADKNNYFILMAYKGNKPGKSSLKLEWNSQYPPLEADMEKAMIWAKNRTTGKISLLGHFNELQSVRLLTPTEWKMIKNSSELFITKNNDPNSLILFKGACIELLNTDNS